MPQPGNFRQPSLKLRPAKKTLSECPKKLDHYTPLALPLWPLDIGSVVGRGFDRVEAAPGAAGPLSVNYGLSRATAVYEYDPAAASWRTLTIYPAK
jgi:hypothetical protein